MKPIKKIIQWNVRCLKSILTHFWHVNWLWYETPGSGPWNKYSWRCLGQFWEWLPSWLGHGVSPFNDRNMTQQNFKSLIFYIITKSWCFILPPLCVFCQRMSVHTQILYHCSLPEHLYERWQTMKIHHLMLRFRLVLPWLWQAPPPLLCIWIAAIDHGFSGLYSP